MEILVASKPSMSNNIYQSNNMLAQTLLNFLEKESVCSPLSVLYILSLLHLGAGGSTESQLGCLLGRKNTWEELATVCTAFNNDIIKLANAILVNKSFPVVEEYLANAKPL